MKAPPSGAGSNRNGLGSLAGRVGRRSGQHLERDRSQPAFLAVESSMVEPTIVFSDGDFDAGIEAQPTFGLTTGMRMRPSSGCESNGSASVLSYLPAFRMDNAGRAAGRPSLKPSPPYVQLLTSAPMASNASAVPPTAAAGPPNSLPSCASCALIALFLSTPAWS